MPESPLSAFILPFMFISTLFLCVFFVAEASLSRLPPVRSTALAQVAFRCLYGVGIGGVYAICTNDQAIENLWPGICINSHINKCSMCNWNPLIKKNYTKIDKTHSIAQIFFRHFCVCVCFEYSMFLLIKTSVYTQHLYAVWAREHHKYKHFDLIWLWFGLVWFTFPLDVFSFSHTDCWNVCLNAWCHCRLYYTWLLSAVSHR